MSTVGQGDDEVANVPVGGAGGERSIGSRGREQGAAQGLSLATAWFRSEWPWSSVGAALGPGPSGYAARTAAGRKKERKERRGAWKKDDKGTRNKQKG